MVGFSVPRPYRASRFPKLAVGSLTMQMKTRWKASPFLEVGGIAPMITFSLDFEAVATLAAAAAVLVSLIGIWLESRRANLSTRATMLREFLKEFDYDLRPTRYRLALFLLARLEGEPSTAADLRIMDFFDVLAMHQFRGLLDMEMIWESFGYWLGHYYRLMRDDMKISKTPLRRWITMATLRSS